MRREESITLGRRLLNHALGGVKLDELPSENIDKVLSDLRIESTDELLTEIGLGELMSVVIARRLLGNADELNAKDNHHRLPIQGADGILLTYANCCHPIPGSNCCSC